MTFAMVLKRRPVSAGAGGRHRFVEAVREEARLVAPSPLPSRDRMYARIVWFHHVSAQGDLDNIVKPILDALESVVYDNDRRIAECLAVRIDAQSRYELPDRSVQKDAYGKLLDALSVRAEHVVYVEVGPADTQRVRFGPIEGRV